VPRVVATALLTATVAMLVVGCGSADEAEEESSGRNTAAGAEQTDAGTDALTATLTDPEGSVVGTVEFSEDDEGGVEVSVEVTDLPPGFHGFHVHGIGVCEPDSANPTDPSMTGDFLSAGGHLGAADSDHGEHSGDLPVLHVGENGAGFLETVTDALTLADLTDDDGSSVMVHADPDNFANVPERYSPEGPDVMTRNTGDSGGRIACGPVED
jgi:Cu-Zn family superoxide dismutase